MVQLNTSTSVVDFLKSKKQESSFSARKKLFNESNLSNRLGDFKGSEAQNRALLRNLQSDAPTLQEVSGTTGIDPSIIDRSKAAIASAQETLAQSRATQTTPPPPPQQTTPTDTSSGRFSLTQIPDIEPASADDILARARGETGVQIAEQEAAINKQAIQSQIPQKISDLRANFASRGLVFSGAVDAGERAIRDEALAKELDVDIRFAKILGNAIDRAQSEMGQEIEEIIDAARDQRKAEVDFLKSVGLAVNPQTGELLPTLEAQKALLKSEGDEFARELSLAKLANDDERIAISKGNLLLSLQKEARIAGDDANNPGDYTASELRKLRAANIDSTGIAESDDFLYGSGARRLFLTPDQTSLIAESIFETIGGKDGFEDIAEAKVAIESNGIIEMNDQTVRLTTLQREAIVAELDFLEQKDVGVPFLPFI